MLKPSGTVKAAAPARESVTAILIAGTEALARLQIRLVPVKETVAGAPVVVTRLAAIKRAAAAAAA